MRQAALLTLGLLACGRLDFDTERAGSDAPTDATDAGGSSDACWAAWRSGAPVLSPAVHLDAVDSGSDEGDPYLTRDGGELFFARGDYSSGKEHAFRAVRHADGTFDPPAPIAALAGEFTTRLTLPTDPTHAVVSGDPSGGGAPANLYQTTRAAVGSAFGPVDESPFPVLDNGDDLLDPDITADGLRLYYSAKTGSGQEVRLATRPTSAAAFGAGTVVAIDDPSLFIADAAVSADELVLVYSFRDTRGGPSQLAVATRAAATDGFTTHGPLTAINTIAGSTYGDAALSPDGCELLFMSDKTGDHDLYMSTVTP